MINPTYKKAFFTSAPSAEAYLGDLKSDGTVPLTADWNVGAFDLTCVDMNATNFKLSGVGTLTSTLGNVSLTTALTAASGDEVGFLLSPTINKAAGNYTAFKINATETSAPGTSDLLIDAQVGTTSKFALTNDGRIGLTRGASASPSIYDLADTDTGMYFADDATYPVRLVIGGSDTLRIGPVYSRFSSKVVVFGDNLNYLSDSGDGTIQVGLDAAAPTNQTLKAPDGIGTNKPGAMLTLQGGQSTGTGTSGSLKFQTAYTSTTGSTANTYYTRQFIDGKVHTVNNNSATAMFSIACADGNAVGGYINYTVEVTDGTDIQLESGTFTFAAVNKATETWTTDADKGTASAVVSGGTLAVTWAVDTATADTVKITVNSNSSLTPTSSNVQFQIFLNSPKVITIL